jgi:hypothetical protein
MHALQKSFRDLSIGHGDLLMFTKKGLTGEAAAWAVCKQNSHRAVSESAMKALKAWSRVNQ